MAEHEATTHWTLQSLGEKFEDFYKKFFEGNSEASLIEQIHAQGKWIAEAEKAEVVKHVGEHDRWIKNFNWVARVVVVAVLGQFVTTACIMFAFLYTLLLQAGRIP